MDFPAGLFPSPWPQLGWLIYALLGWQVLRDSPWSRFRDNAFMHLFLGAGVAVMLLWTLRGGVTPGLSFHLLGVTTLTLMFGWPLAILAVSLVVVMITWYGQGGWDSLALNVLVMGALPILLTQGLLTVAQRWLPHNFFVYVLLNAFFAAGLASLASKLVAVGLLVGAGVHPYSWVAYEYLPYLPLMMFSEAITNGMLITLLAALRPGWLCSFDDARYLTEK